MTNPITRDRLHFEDLETGTSMDLGQIQVSKKMIVEFAREFDPFPFHLDEKAARESLLGGLSASGWQTAALCLRLLVDEFLSKVASMGGLGFSSLKWRRPLMVNDHICASATIAELRRSLSHPEWGIITLDIVVKNQKGQTVMTMTLSNLVEVRNPAIPHRTPQGEMI